MKLSYFNKIHLGKKVNINNIHFSSILNESLLDVRQKMLQIYLMKNLNI